MMRNKQRHPHPEDEIFREFKDQIFREFNTYVNYFISSRQIENDRRALEAMHAVTGKKLRELSRKEKQ